PILNIKGKSIKRYKIKIKSNISSQYISSLILIGPKLVNGLKIKLLNKNISFSYIDMTIKILKKLKFDIKKKNNYIYIKNKKFKKKKKNIKYYIESDWSSASYYYSILSILKKGEIILKNFEKKSCQGDSIICNIYKKYFGITTFFFKNKKYIKIKKENIKKPKIVKLNLESTPDIAQTIIVTCAILRIKCTLTGLKTLNIKETNRLKALKTELKKIGTITKISKEKIKIIYFKKKIKKKILINTYKDHRMAMSFSVLAIKRKIYIENPKTVNKSYPKFWKDLKKIGFYYKKLKII
ncbi:MAG: 3-phosphoshikimate 1-carboxyvinyltransferase, partial [Candidatus Shikimatogenerans sp. JK-2022]|nr:3-phosphoshikimate 1-carboxyvinyltransferase [Candidatus Shikimatogenerans bostrichidophilus]